MIKNVKLIYFLPLIARVEKLIITRAKNFVIL